MYLPFRSFSFHGIIYIISNLVKSNQVSINFTCKIEKARNEKSSKSNNFVLTSLQIDIESQKFKILNIKTKIDRQKFDLLIYY